MAMTSKEINAPITPPIVPKKVDESKVLAKMFLRGNREALVMYLRTLENSLPNSRNLTLTILLELDQ